MKTKINSLIKSSINSLLVVLLLIPLCLPAQYAFQNRSFPGPTNNRFTDETPENTIDTSRIQMGAFFGAVSINGKNYQEVGFRGDFPIGKLGFGIDFQLHIDDDGNIYKEDWDEWTDYLDKLYYIRWAHKKDPFYFKLGGLNYCNLGYSNIVSGYTNMVEFPTIKRWGGELSFYLTDYEDEKKVGMELFINDFKEMFKKKASMLIGTRVFYRPVGKLELGVTYATDLNEYNGLQDFDDDGVPDAVDDFDDDKNWASDRDETEYRLKQIGTPNEEIEITIRNMIRTHKIRAETGDELRALTDKTQISQVVGADIGYPLMESSLIKLDVYSHFTQIINHGWGVALPGVRLMLGQRGFLTFKAEYLRASKEFMFGYYDNTYEIERAFFIEENDKLIIKTKQDRLNEITEATNGIFAGLDVNILGLVYLNAYYRGLVNNNKRGLRSVKGEVGLGDKLRERLPINIKGYYFQNNVQNFQRWKSEGTVMGYLLSYNFKGVDMGFDYRFTFKDLNGDGRFNNEGETIKTIGVRAGMKF